MNSEPNTVEPIEHFKEQIVCEHNRLRAMHGCPPLQWSEVKQFLRGQCAVVHVHALYCTLYL